MLEHKIFMLSGSPRLRIDLLEVGLQFRLITTDPRSSADTSVPAIDAKVKKTRKDEDVL